MVWHALQPQPIPARTLSLQAMRTPLLLSRTGTENSPSWPGFFEGAIVTGEDTAAQLDALLKQNGGGVAPELSSDDAWDLPRSHTQRFVAPVTGLVG